MAVRPQEPHSLPPWHPAKDIEDAADDMFELPDNELGKVARQLKMDPSTFRYCMTYIRTIDPVLAYEQAFNINDMSPKTLVRKAYLYHDYADVQEGIKKLSAIQKTVMLLDEDQRKMLLVNNIGIANRKGDLKVAIAGIAELNKMEGGVYGGGDGNEEVLEMLSSLAKVLK